ncbi:uncharacterized protein LOC129618930 [Condylostylus longicornis]|uniref:uncharacterized protein LOC129618930 n=1 Tax=Condylostylus longicornis TaxID=2530218 RepID=UPI00244E4F6D|nr:uncharacterized protein LOC129618930 [Condylostylus longicornis]
MVASRKFIGVLLFQLLISLNNYSGILCSSDQYEGDECEWRGKRGVCVSLKNCQSLTKELSAKTITFSDLENCAFNGNDYVACCTDIDPSALPRKSDTSSTGSTTRPNVYFPDDPYLSEIKKKTSTESPQTINRISKRPTEVACDGFKKEFPGKTLGQKIIGGKAAEIGEYPHMAALGYGTGELTWDCAGSLISDRYVLTAGHCVSSRTNQPVMVRMGRNNIKEDDPDDLAPTDVTIENVTLHRRYRSSESYNDIALIKLSRPVTFQSGLHPACLYTKTEDLNEAMNLTIAGWGTTNISTRAKSDFLQKATVRTVPFEKCSTISALTNDRRLLRGLLNSQLCANDDTADTCQGDSGGPLLIANDERVSTIIGITSFGISCATEIPGVYTRVASYLDWIESIVWPTLQNSYVTSLKCLNSKNSMQYSCLGAQLQQVPRSNGNLTDNELCSSKDGKIVVCCTDNYSQLKEKSTTIGSQYENYQRKKRRVVFPILSWKISLFNMLLKSVSDNLELIQKEQRMRVNDDRLEKARDRQYFKTMYGNQAVSLNTGSTMTRSTENPRLANGMTSRMLSRTETIKKRPAEIACDNYVNSFPSQVIRNYIVGLRQKADVAEFPHMVALGYGVGSYEFRCAGTLISDSYVLTAAHCIEPSSKPVIARMGRNNIKDDDTDNYSPTDVRIQNIITHKSYKSVEFYNDIALLKLARPVKFTNGLHPACLYTKIDDLSETQKLVITGWGVTDLKYQKTIHLLQKANVRTVPLNKCAAKPEFKNVFAIPRGVTNSQICAYSEVSDTCEGDSGGPLLIEDDKKVATVIGITSFGMSCGTNTPGLYTRVAYYLNWIESIVCELVQGHLQIERILDIHYEKVIGLCKYLQAKEGSSCQWKGTPGICTLVENCMTLQNYLITGKLYLKDIQQCKHNGTEMIACCTDTESIRLYFTKRDRRSVSQLDNVSTHPDFASDSLDYSEMMPEVESKALKKQRPAVRACNRFKKEYAELPIPIENRIFAGVETKKDELPHVVALGYGDPQLDWDCAGTLISRRFVLTSARCVQNVGKPPVVVRIGHVNIRNDKSYDDVKIQNIIKHEYFVSTKGYNDIALLKLAKRVNFSSSIFPACLYTHAEDISPEVDLTISGWGILSVIEREQSEILQNAITHFVPSEECSTKEYIKNDSRLPDGIIESQLCAYDEFGSVCRGDAGGPLEIRNQTSISTVVGITSIGLSCGARTPSVYTRVSSYLDWIEPKVWPKLKN